MPDAERNAPPPPKRGRGLGKNNSRRCDPYQIQRAREWADWYGIDRLMRGIHPNGLTPREQRED